MSGEDIHLYLFSHVLPSPSSAGQLLLHRHLVERNDFVPLQLDTGTKPSFVGRWERRLIGRLSRTRFHRLAANWTCLRAGKEWDEQLAQFGPTKAADAAVLTVAHGTQCFAAQRYAEARGLPLVTIFHDWWPDMEDIGAVVRRVLDDRFVALHRASALSLCVSEGMKKALGPHENAQVLLPIPGASSRSHQAATPGEKFKILYFGNLYDYGPMLQPLMEYLEDHPRIRLEVRGSSPPWAAEFRDRMTNKGLYLPFAPVDECQQWLGSADAFLIPMRFEQSMRRRMETSFPSKLPESVSFGKPVIVWGPETCSAVQWARGGAKALTINSDQLREFESQVEQLRLCSQEQERLGACAELAARQEFNPDLIHAQFVSEVRRISSMK